MALVQEMDRLGNILFKRRSYIPLILYVIVTGLYFFNHSCILGLTEPWISLIGISISMVGIAVRVIAVGFSAKHTSGRNISGQVAESVNTLGIYSIVRHPLYVGNYLMWLGLVAYTEILWLVVVVTLLYWLYYERIIIAEELFLTEKFGKEFTLWADKTPCFIPKPSLWKSTGSMFHFKKVISNEIYGLTAISVSFFYINLLKNYTLYNVFKYEKHLLIFLIFTLLLFLIIRYLKKRTKIFHD